MVKLCGMKASSTFENKRDKVFERYEIDPTLFKMDSSIEGGENANYAQTECQFRYCGTAIPFLTVRSTAR